MKLTSSASIFAAAWLPTTLTTLIPALVCWYAFRPDVGPPPEFVEVLPLVVITSLSFAIPAALVGALFWPITRRVIGRTRAGSRFRLLYGAAAGAATGLAFVGVAAASALPFTFNWIGSLVAIPPSAATGLLWAIWFEVLQWWLGGASQPVPKP